MLWLSLHKYNQLAPVAPFIGLRNFDFAFTTDALFVNALIVTLKYALVAVPLNLIIALPIAIGLNQVTRLAAVPPTSQVMPITPGGPINSTSTLVYYIYTKAFSNMQLGYASAISVVLMVIILFITLIQFRLLRSRWEY